MSNKWWRFLSTSMSNLLPTIHLLSTFLKKVAESQGPVCPSYHLRTFSELGQLGLLFLPNNINMRLALRKNHWKYIIMETYNCSWLTTLCPNRSLIDLNELIEALEETTSWGARVNITKTARNKTHMVSFLGTNNIKFTPKTAYEYVWMISLPPYSS